MRKSSGGSLENKMDFVLVKDFHLGHKMCISIKIIELLGPVPGSREIIKQEFHC